MDVTRIIKAGPIDPKTYAKRYKQKVLENQDTVFRREQQLKKEKIGDSLAVLVDEAELRAKQGQPMTKKELATRAAEVLAQMNFEQPTGPTGTMTDRPVGDQGSEFSLPEYAYYMDMIKAITEGIPIEHPKGNITTDGVKPETPERFRSLAEQGLKKARHSIAADPEMKEVLPQYVKEQKTGMPVPLSIPKLDNFEDLSHFMNRHS